MRSLTYWKEKQKYRLTVFGTLAKVCVEMTSGYCSLYSRNSKDGVKPEAV